MSLKAIVHKILAFFKNLFNNIKTTDQAAGMNLGIFQPKNRNLYALIVGINKYKFKERPGRINDLGGCVRDATCMLDYLKSVTSEGDFNFHPIFLSDETATRKNIISNFKHHLTKATENDVALFYFSGHGVQEKADKVWFKEENDQLLETIVCHDTQNKKNGIPGLADKEFRYLINVIAKKNPHIVTISDSCHSGDNTRTGELRKRCVSFTNETQTNVPKEQARLVGAFPMRTWEQFCFADKLTPEIVQNADALEDIIPQGKHIAFAACKDHELAYETLGANSSGIFTTTLLDVLKRSSGNITYYDLYTRIRNTVFGKRHSQMPQIYASSGNAMDLKEIFLSGASNQKPNLYNVSKNPMSHLDWIIELGAIHGMPSAGANKELIINILDPNNPSKTLTTATPYKVMPSYTQLTITDKEVLKNSNYTATVDGLFSNPINFYITGKQQGVDSFKAYANTKSTDLKRSNVNIIEDSALADYMIIANKAEEVSYFIGPPIDESKAFTTYSIQQPNKETSVRIPYWKWNTKPCIGSNSKTLGTLMSYMQHITRWEFLKRLKNPVTPLIVDDIVSVKFYQGKYDGKKLIEKMELIPNKDNVIETGFPYTSKKEKPLNHLLIDIQNIHNEHTIYAAMPALFNDFSIYTDVLRGGSVEFAPNHKESAHKGQSLPYEIQHYIKTFNYEYVPIFFQLIISISDFDVTSFAQEGLPTPSVNDLFGKGIEEDPNGAVQNVTKEDWTTKMYEVRFKNPFYVKPNPPVA